MSELIMINYENDKPTVNGFSEGKDYETVLKNVIRKALAIFCQNRAIRIKKCETNDERFGTVNSYPLMVLKDYLGENY